MQIVDPSSWVIQKQQPSQMKTISQFRMLCNRNLAVTNKIFFGFLKFKILSFYPTIVNQTWIKKLSICVLNEVQDKKFPQHFRFSKDIQLKFKESTFKEFYSHEVVLEI